MAEKLTKEQFQSKAVKVHGGKYLYNLPDDFNNNVKIEMICDVHGSFHQTPVSHLTGRGCRKCYHVSVSERCRSTTEEFVRRATQVHSGRYTYEQAEYRKKDLKVNISCKVHGVFSQEAHSHLSGRGCRKCSKNGFKVGKAGHLYVMQCDDITKVGVANNDPKIRAKAISSDYGKDFSVLTFKTFSNGQECLDAETKLLRELARQYKKPLDVFSGSTECFLDVNVAQLLSRINELQWQVAPQ